MPDYSKVFVYKICCRDASIEEIYVGSTCNLTRRKTEHKRNCTNEARKEYTCPVYKFIRDHGGWDNWDTVMIEEFSCETKMQKDKKERGWVEALKSKLNKNTPANYQTGEVYDKKEYRKAYEEENMVKIKEVRKEFRKKIIHCPCCDTMINLNNRFQHNKTQKHKSNSSSSSSSSGQ